MSQELSPGRQNVPILSMVAIFLNRVTTAMQFVSAQHRAWGSSVFVITGYWVYLRKSARKFFSDVGSVVKLLQQIVDTQQIIQIIPRQRGTYCACFIVCLPNTIIYIYIWKGTALFLDPFSVEQNIISRHLQKVLKQFRIYEWQLVSGKPGF